MDAIECTLKKEAAAGPKLRKVRLMTQVWGRNGTGSAHVTQKPVPGNGSLTRAVWQLLARLTTSVLETPSNHHTSTKTVNMSFAWKAAGLR